MTNISGFTHAVNYDICIAMSYSHIKILMILHTRMQRETIQQDGTPGDVLHSTLKLENVLKI